MTDLALHSDNNIHLSLTGCTLSEGLPFDTWADLLSKTVQVRGACHWILGDQLLYGENNYGERFAQAVTLTGLRLQTLRNVASVCRKIPYHRRRPDLSFSHHAEVASLPDDEQDALLQIAAEQDLPADALRDLRQELTDQEDSERETLAAETPPQTSKTTQEPEAAPDRETDPTPPTTNADTKQAEPETTEQTDQNGEPVPEGLRDAWEKRRKMLGWVLDLGRIKKAVLALHENADPVATYLEPGEWQAALTNAQRLLQATTPHVLCPYCKGLGCNQCAECGWMSKYRYDHTVPENVK
jgi:hypothetical protein